MRCQRDKQAHTGRKPTRTCEAAGCSTTTREAKPYCSTHVLLQPYVRGILAEIEAQDREVEAVRRRGTRAVDPDGLTAREILRSLEVHGPRSLPRLAKDLSLERAVVESYVTILTRRKKVRVTRTERKVPLVHSLTAVTGTP